MEKKYVKTCARKFLAHIGRAFFASLAFPFFKQIIIKKGLCLLLDVFTHEWESGMCKLRIILNSLGALNQNGGATPILWVRNPTKSSFSDGYTFLMYLSRYVAELEK